MKIENFFTEYYNLKVKLPIQQEIIQKTLPKLFPFKFCHIKEGLVSTAWHWSVYKNGFKVIMSLSSLRVC